MIYLDSLTEIALNGLADPVGNPIDDATVTAVIADLDGNTLATVDLTASGTGGNYAGLITPAMTTGMQNQEEYVVAVTSVVGGNVVDYRQDNQLAAYRGFND